ncbi:MAG: hypothetical protein GF388_12050, partial [Candidatus Aegiribacteria sp.]|nr:hypothetical protein [Candidatus Aegiribacteria sp.]MBD3295696.1 hypothetical protein [Candidatus Fermentibacteria bacterium]
MTFSHLAAMILLAGLQPGRQLPEDFDSAMTAALDSLDINRNQLDFDKHWVTGVALADSTVIDAIQHVEELPLILENEILQLEDYASLNGYGNGLHALEDLVEMLETLKLDAEGRMTDMGPGRSDSLAALIPQIWIHEDDPLDWDSILSQWDVPEPEEEMEMDSLAKLMDSADCSQEVPIADLVRLALTLVDADWPEELSVTLPGVQGTTASFCFQEPLRWVVGGTGPNRYTAECPFELIVDLGGDDFYGEGIGGSAGPAGKYVSIVIDMEGRDTYCSTGPFSQGCGFMGVGGVIDLKGDDTYTAGDFSQGAGIMGTGFLID